MEIRYTTGDIIANEGEAEAFALDLSPVGMVQNAIALQFQYQFPEMFEAYRAACESDPPGLHTGDVFPYEHYDGTRIYGLAVYRDEFFTAVHSDQVEKAYTALRAQLEAAGVTSVAMPPIAAGLSSLNWGRSLKHLRQVFEDWEGVFWVYTREDSQK